MTFIMFGNPVLAWYSPAGERRFYRLEAAERGSDELDGLFDRFGFLPR